MTSKCHRYSIIKNQEKLHLTKHVFDIQLEKTSSCFHKNVFGLQKYFRIFLLKHFEECILDAFFGVLSHVKKFSLMWL